MLANGGFATFAHPCLKKNGIFARSQHRMDCNRLQSTAILCMPRLDQDSRFTTEKKYMAVYSISFLRNICIYLYFLFSCTISASAQPSTISLNATAPLFKARVSGRPRNENHRKSQEQMSQQQSAYLNMYLYVCMYRTSNLSVKSHHF